MGLRLLEFVFFCFKRGFYRVDKEVYFGSKKSCYVVFNKISKVMEFFNYGFRERVKVRIEMKMVGIDVYNWMLENKLIIIERVGIFYF